MTEPSQPKFKAIPGGKDPSANGVQVEDTDELSEETLPPGANEADRIAHRSRTPVQLKRARRDRAFGRFELLIEMAKGGMATLYLARIRGPKQFEKLLAIKKIHDHLAEDPELVSMFLDEARIAALLNHSNIASIFDLGRIEGSYFIAMEYVHGQNLTDILRSASRKGGGFPWPYAARIVADAATGLHAAHELKGPEGKLLNVVHRDVSPHNILISYDGNVKLVDFGIAFAAEKGTQTDAGVLKGKTGYMAPEQASGDEIDRRCDIFALGIVLHEALTLKRLFKERTQAATLLKVREAVFPNPRESNPDISSELEEIILKAMAKEPGDRYQTAEQMAEALNELLASKGEAVTPKKIAALMNDIFYDRKKLKDKQVEQALKSESPVAVKGVAMVGSTDTAIEIPSYGDMPGRRRSRKPLLFGAAGVGLILLGVLLAFLIKGTGSSESGKTPPARVSETAGGPRAVPDPMKARPAPRPTEITLRIKVEPATDKAEVLFRGMTYKGSKFEVKVVPSDRPEKLEIRSPGYKTASLMIVPNQNNRFTVKLDRAPRREPRKRRRRRRRRRRPRLKKLPW